MKAGIYGRESKGKTKSVADQVRLGVAAVGELGWTLARTWKDRVSASRGRAVRAEWPLVLAAIEAGGIEVLILWEASRGSRDMAEWVALLDACRDHKVLVHIVNDERTYNPRKAGDRKRLLNDGVDAEAETGRSAERIVKGIDSAAAEGGFHGRAPFGYERVIVGEERNDRGVLKPVRQQRIHPVNGPIATEVITRVASNESLRSIERDMNARGVEAPEGGPWTSHTVRNLTRRRTYLGQRHHRPVDGRPATVHKGTWDALVAESVWTLANEILDDPGRKTGEEKPGALKYLLTSIMHGHCGGRTGIDKPDDSRPRYKCLVDECASVAMADADAWVVEVLVTRLSKKDARAAFVPDDAPAAAARAELVALTAKLAEARASFERVDGLGISAETMAGSERRLAPLIADAQRRARPRGVPLALLALLDAAEVGADHVGPAWTRLPLPGQRELIRFLCPSIAVHPATVRLTRHTSPAVRRDLTASRVVIRLADGDVVGGPRVSQTITTA